MNNEQHLGTPLLFQVGIVDKSQWGIGWEWDGRQGKETPPIFYDLTNKIPLDDFIKHLAVNQLPYYDLRR